MAKQQKNSLIAAPSLVSKGLSLLSEAKPADAYAAFRLGLNLAPDDPFLHTALARTCLILSATHLAAYHAQTALEHESQNLDAIILLAEAARREGNRDLCLKQMAKFANIPAAKRMHRWLELSLTIEDGDFENALCDIAALLEETPNDPMFESLFEKGFDFFKVVADQTRFESFVDGLGLSCAPNVSPPQFSAAGPEQGSIDVIIPVFNALNDLQACLNSIRHCKSPALGKIILVDDFSDPPTANWMQELVAKEPNIVLLRNLENLGFTRTVMKGLAYSTSAFPVILNSDTWVTLGWLDGLWQAMQCQPTTALVGPLSDNGYHQTIMPKTSVTSAPFAGPIEASAHVDRAAAMVLLNSRKKYPVVPLLSGFCLMIRREAYDRVGGFDAGAFPEGYWELQDLGFKLIDQGMKLVIADDVFVHHAGSASISSDRKKRLHSAGLVKMYKRYSALRLLTAERLAAHEPEIEHHKRGWWRDDMQLNKMSPNRFTAEMGDETRPRMSCRILLQPKGDFAEREVCLFVVHAPYGTASEYTKAYIRAVRDAHVYVIVCLVVEELDIPVDAALLAASDALMIRLNGGYDFAVWADMLVTCPQVWSADRLYFLNDSITGPFAPLDPIFDKIRMADAGFFALTEAVYPDYHAQSFFFGWSQANLSAPALRAFWESVRVHRDKALVINLYEKSISPLSTNLPDQTQQIVFNLRDFFDMDAKSVVDFSPTHKGWQKLIDGGFPFIKTDVIRDEMHSSIITTNWREHCVSKGADIDMLNRHVEMSRTNRLQRFSSLPLGDAKAEPLGDAKADLNAKEARPKRSASVKRRRIFFHIGFGKTGSSTLQRFLSRNAAQLESLGVSYPHPETHDGQTGWIGNLFANIMHRARQFGSGYQQHQDIVDQQFALTVDAALSESKASTVVFSGEFMGSYLNTHTLKYLKNLSEYHDVSLIAFVRDSYDHAMSSWKQIVKANVYRSSFDTWVNATLDTEKLPVQRLHLIAMSGIDVKIFNYDHHKKSLASTFMQIIGLDPVSPGIIYEDDLIVNPSFSYWQCRSIVMAQSQTGATYLSAMLLNQFHELPDFRKDPVIADIDSLILNRLSVETAWVNEHLPESERLRETARDVMSLEEPEFSDADVSLLMATVGDYIRAVKIPTTLPQELLTAGLPADFNPEEYLVLNPDVAKAKVGAAEHYLDHGRHEGRPYRAS